MTLLHKQDMQGRLDETLLNLKLRGTITTHDDDSMTGRVILDEEPITALTQLIEDYVVAARIEELMSVHSNEHEFGAGLSREMMYDRIEQLKSKETK